MPTTKRNFMAAFLAALILLTGFSALAGDDCCPKAAAKQSQIETCKGCCNTDGKTCAEVCKLADCKSCKGCCADGDKCKVSCKDGKACKDCCVDGKTCCAMTTTAKTCPADGKKAEGCSSQGKGDGCPKAGAGCNKKST